MRNAKWLTVLLILVSAPASAAINVTFEKIARTGDQVPGREHLNVVFDGRAFQRYGPGVFSRPCINDAGQAVFMGWSKVPNTYPNRLTTIGLYLKSPGSPLQLIVDQSDDNAWNTASVGAPFAVPGRSAEAVFLNFMTPLINNRGDILFHAQFYDVTAGVSGTGFYAYRALDQQVVKIVDTLDDVPGYPGQTFNGFSYSRNPKVQASMNDQGQVIFLGRFRLTGESYEDQGLYGYSIDGAPTAGGPFVRLVDSTETVLPANETVPFRGLSYSNEPAINNNGIVIFHGAIGNPPPATLLNGIFTIPVDGSAGATTIARRGQLSPPLSDGNQWGYYSTFGGQDINDAGQFTFLAAFYRASWSPHRNVILAGNLATPGDPLSVVVDTLGGYSVPGQPAGTNFRQIPILGAMNEMGQTGFYGHDDGPISNGHGLYAADLAASPFAVIGHNDDVPPGRVAPAKFSDFSKGTAINDLGNMALSPGGSDTSTDLLNLFGLYFFDGCTNTLERVFDDETSQDPMPDGLGDRFLKYGESGCTSTPFSGCDRGIRIFSGIETRSGHFTSINNNDDIGFLVAFSTFNVGVYMAHVEAGGGGDLRIVCPKDLTLECPVADTSSTATGEPRVCSDNPVTVTSSDATVPGCGTTATITRTWTANDGATQVSCNQVIEVVDTTDPTLVGVPDDAAVECTAVPPPANPTVTDDCDAGATISLNEVQTPGSCEGEFILTRTWTATDACSNSTTRSQILTVGNTTAPVLTIPPNATIDCDGDSSPDGTGAANATAGCAGAPTITFVDSVVVGACGSNTVITRTWTATDACGNSASGVQTITVSDATPPVLTAPANVTIQCDADASPAGTGIASAADGCPGAVTVNFTDETTANGLCGAGTQITRTWTATDACNNIVSADQVITVVDTTPPVLTLPGDVSIACDADSSTASTGTATATDACGEPVTIVSSDVEEPGTCPQGSLIVRTWTATDECGNSAGSDQTITLNDNTPPVVTVPADAVVECDADSSPAGTGSATATDNCDSDPGVSFADSAAAGSCPNESSITRTWTAVDGCSNSAGADQIITTVDTTDPTISNLDGTPLLVPIGDPFSLTATFEDNCAGAMTATWDLGDGTIVGPDPATSPASVTHSYAAQDIYSITVEIRDACGNLATDEIVVVAFDPNDGFTTGGGWFIPDAESFIDGTLVTSTTAKANFGFVVKYHHGANTTSGNLEFVYKSGDIDLHSLDMEWLVITSATKVRFKGLASINGEGEYTFKVTGEDNGNPGSDDTFKIEIWLGVVDTENGPPTPKHMAQGVLGGGNIKVHN